MIIFNILQKVFVIFVRRKMRTNQINELFLKSSKITNTIFSRSYFFFNFVALKVTLCYKNCAKIQHIFPVRKRNTDYEVCC